LCLLPAAPRSAAPFASAAGLLLLALLAAEGLERSTEIARRSAALVLIALVAACLSLRAPDPGPAPAAADPPDELVSWSVGPGGALSGRVHPVVAFDRLRLRAERLDARGRPS